TANRRAGNGSRDNGANASESLASAEFVFAHVIPRYLAVVGPHPHDLYLATFGRSTVVATTICFSAKSGPQTKLAFTAVLSIDFNVGRPAYAAACTSSA